MKLKAEHLQTFSIVARQGSVSRAAEVLGLSQPAVSRQLAQLQHHLGEPLYERSASGVRLTRTGEELLHYAESIELLLQHTQHFLEGRSATTEHVRIGLSHHLIASYTGPLLQRQRVLRQQGVGLELHLTEGYTHQLVEQVETRAVDAALILSSAPLSDIIAAHTLTTTSLCLLVKPDDPLAQEGYLPSQYLNGETLILPASVSSVYKRLRRYLDMMQVRPGRIIEVSGPFAVRSAVLDGLGIGITNKGLVAAEIAHNLLRAIPIDADGFEVDVQLIRHSHTLMQTSLSAHIDFLFDVQQG